MTFSTIGIAANPSNKTARAAHTIMDKNSILQYKNQFDSITHHIRSEDAKEKIEVCFVRELQTILGYARWENFSVAIHRAVASCKSQQINVDNLFRDLTKKVEIAKVDTKIALSPQFSCLTRLINKQ